jgi:hypothetical protein
MGQGLKLEDTIGNVVQLTGGILNFGSAIENLANLGDIWNNDDLTTGEKMLQIIMSMTTGLAMLASSIQQIREGAKAFTEIKGLIKTVSANIAKAKSEKELAKATRETT